MFTLLQVACILTPLLSTDTGDELSIIQIVPDTDGLGFSIQSDRDHPGISQSYDSVSLNYSLVVLKFKPHIHNNTVAKCKLTRIKANISGMKPDILTMIGFSSDFVSCYNNR